MSPSHNLERRIRLKVPLPLPFRRRNFGLQVRFCARRNSRIGDCNKFGGGMQHLSLILSSFGTGAVWIVYLEGRMKAML